MNTRQQVREDSSTPSHSSLAPISTWNFINETPDTKKWHALTLILLGFHTLGEKNLMREGFRQPWKDKDNDSETETILIMISNW